MARAKKRASTEKSLAKRRECKKISMRRARQKLKQNPEAFEEAKRKDRERKKTQRKSINEMSDREKRKIRKQWKVCSKTYRKKKKEDENLCKVLENSTPPASPDQSHSTPVTLPPTSRVRSGSKRRRRNKEAMKREMKDLKYENEKLKRKVNMYRQKLHRMQKSTSEITPRKKVKEMLKGQTCSKEVRKHLIFGEVLKKQIRKNFLESKRLRDKRYLARVISGKILKKYKFASSIASITSRRFLKSTPTENRKEEVLKILKARKAIRKFLEQDENSTQCAGKKETITRDKNKMQKRFLNDSLKSLHQKFISTCDEYKEMSYAYFCKLRPFWILVPDCRNRDTCLCKLHANMSLVVKKLSCLGIINEKNTDEVLKSITCDENLKEKCLERKCEYCKEIEIKYNEYDENDTVIYYQWVDKKIELEMKQKKKICKKTVKEEVSSTKKKLVSLFKWLLITFLRHVNNIKHQYAAIRFIKENLKTNEALLHLDFSENYNCKYSQEIQSVHFGGSRNQVTLHTSILYFREEEGSVKSVPFCTISEERRHDAVAICGHLKPVLTEIKTIIQNLEKIHFVSDGPSSQYRNRKMFSFSGTYLSTILQVSSLHWHYLEAGHGKGAPDGVGGCLKRTADNIVARGVDIPNVDILVQQLKGHCPGITIFHVSAEEVLYCDQIKLTVPTFQGTLKTHEISWCKNEKNVIQVRRLTCTSCTAAQICLHYSIGQIGIESTDCNVKCKLKYSDVYSDTESEPSLESLSDEEFGNDPSNPKIFQNDYVIVKLAGKKSIKFYVALVISQDFNDEYTVKFMRKCSNETFVFPEKDDISEVNLGDIIEVLRQPTMNKREQYVFSENLEKYNLK